MQGDSGDHGVVGPTIKRLLLVVVMKSTVGEIRQRFDADVERFSNLETGQSVTVDAPLAMVLIAQAAAATTTHARHVLDVGCEARMIDGLRPP
jgi:hypothetical protein